jgi:hypothetical protein
MSLKKWFRWLRFFKFGISNKTYHNTSEVKKEMYEKFIERFKPKRLSKKEIERIMDINKKRQPGLKFTRYCNCGNYQPKSSSGLINTNCRNCGGKKPQKKLKK